MISTAIEVQLVGQSPLVLILPAVAIVISMLSIGLTLWFRYQERFKLKVTASWSMMMDADLLVADGWDRVNVEVINRSRTASTQITALVVALPKGRTFAYMEPGPGDSVLPMTLGPGERASISYPASGLGTALKSMAPMDREWVRGKAVSGHKEVFGKRLRKMPATLVDYSVKFPRKKMPDGSFQPANS